eukprot:CAMPEP_0197354842 /NCGR_PEP_ID=MMETSP0893-20130614/44376_1 /TAXON_ID=44058 ORGANISM="Aureoumbra lagunensis, Strain CCMP1510" /NCGR_SAMPLE_ID=MMETSP0893 /ASSEMBLY_ACC=CAM_ASM_000539 /LENGTH=213 /DNA_ID=CAMNT_0042871289 /DNA_START=41 /DNA_END=682 /DNA_ORIENTATION=-
MKEPSVEKYIAEMRSSREAILSQMTQSSLEISSRCQDAMRNNVTANELFSSDERDRIVKAFADKLRVSREETLAKLEARQRTERANIMAELKQDLSEIVDSVIDKLKTQIESNQKLTRQQLEKKHNEEMRSFAKQQQQHLKAFHETCLVNLRASLAEQRADALKRFTAEINAYKDNQLEHAFSTSFDDHLSVNGSEQLDNTDVASLLSTSHLT